jgi:Uma2 family endonuclease
MTAVTESVVLHLGPEANGMLLTPEEFDAAEFAEGWRYELIRGVLIVSPAPSRKERDPNEELGAWLRVYSQQHPQGGSLDATLSEETIPVDPERRRADRVIWAGLGRLPEPSDPPTIVVEYVSAGRSSRRRDYEEKRTEYLAIGVREYWVIDRFDRTLTVFSQAAGSFETTTVREDQTYTTPLLPGFQLRLARLLQLANRWER